MLIAISILLRSMKLNIHFNIFFSPRVIEILRKKVAYISAHLNKIECEGAELNHYLNILKPDYFNSSFTNMLLSWLISFIQYLIWIFIFYVSVLWQYEDKLLILYKLLVGLCRYIDDQELTKCNFSIHSLTIPL